MEKSKSLLYLILISFLVCCKAQLPKTNPNVQFKGTLPFEINQNEILIDINIGNDSIPKKMKFDTGAPMSADLSIIRDTSSIKCSSSEINGVVHDKTFKTRRCKINKVKIENIEFKDITIYNLPNINSDSKIKRSYVGLLGNDLLKQGIWQVNFKEKNILFTNNIDSVKNIKKYTKLKCHYNAYLNCFFVNLNLNGSLIKDVLIDFGSNQQLTLVKKDFNRINKGNMEKIFNGTRTTQAGKMDVKYYKLYQQKYYLKNKTINTDVLSSDNNKINTIGLEFFLKFDSVILDYINNNIYIQLN